MHSFMSWNLKVQIMKVETKFPHFSKKCLLALQSGVPFSGQLEEGDKT